MPKFTVEHQSNSNPQDTFVRLKDFFTKTNEMKKFDPKVECTFNDATQTCHIKGSQFKADVNIQTATAGSKVNVIVDLPLLLSPFKGKVQDELTKMLKKHLG